MFLSSQLRENNDTMQYSPTHSTLHSYMKKKTPLLPLTGKCLLYDEAGLACMFTRVVIGILFSRGESFGP